MKRLAPILILAFTGHAGAQTLPLAEMRMLAEALRLVRASYVDEVSDAAFTASCKTGILKAFTAAGGDAAAAEQARAIETALPADLGVVIASLHAKHPDAGARKLVDGCLDQVTASLDPHSAYLNVEKFKELSASSRGGFASFGMELVREDDRIKVVAPLEGSPAEKAGIRSGDILLSVDGKDLTGMPLEDAVKILRGRPGSSGKLTIARKDVAEPLTVGMTREVIRVQTVKARILPGRYLYIRITQLQERTLEDLGNALRTHLDDKDGIAGIVLDLRGNKGGLLTTSVGVPAAFLPPGMPAGKITGREPNANKEFTTVPEHYGNYRMTPDALRNLPTGASKLPMMVLVNRVTASGAELAAATLQDHRRAKIAGEQTLGYGTVQTMFQIETSTALKLTTAKIIRAGGAPLDKKGVTPDIPIAMTRQNPIDLGSEQDTDLHTALKLFERGGKIRK